MIFVGTFNENDILEGKDKIAIQKKKEETGLNYTEMKLVKKKGEIVGLKVWVCNYDEFTI